MNNDLLESMLTESKRYVKMHANAMGFSPAFTEATLGKIITLAGHSPGSWASEWQALTDQALAASDLNRAYKLATLARFPFAGDATNPLQTRCCEIFRMKQQKDPSLGITLTLKFGTTTVKVLLHDAKKAAPLLFVMGGIVSNKEQWSTYLKLGRRLGCNVAIADFPGLGENGFAYHPESGQDVRRLLDALSLHMRFSKVICLAMSFAGHLMMSTALDDPRIVSIATVGAPISRFFLDRAWWSKVPLLTKATLARHTRLSLHDLDEGLAGFSLYPQDLRRLTATVYYVALTQDDIIPATDWCLLRAQAEKAHLLELDDVHGGPNHLPLVRLFLLRSVLAALRRPVLYRGVLAMEALLRLYYLSARTLRGRFLRRLAVP